jgi:hypothetical protein
MKRMMLLAPLGALLLAPSAGFAQSPLDGTWKIDMNKVTFPQKPDVFLLQNGMYSCKTCTPPYTVKADGTDQPVTGHPYFDSVAIKVVNDHEIQETDKKGGKTVATSDVVISSDGKTATYTFTDSSDTNGGAPVKGKGSSTLVMKGPAGSHAVSGSWRQDKMESLSENAIMWTYKVNGNQLTMTNPTGQTYTATFNGADAPMKGDPGITSVSLKKMGNTLEETDKRDGKVIGVFKVAVAADGKTAKASYTDTRQNRTTQFDAVKQ